MPTYIYKARDDAGKAVNGTMDALSKEELAEKLRKMGYLPTHIKETTPGVNFDDIGQRFQRIRTEDIIMFNIQLANMMDSGLTILSSLSTISQQIENKKLRDIIDEVRRAVEGGSSFSDALARHQRIFSKLFINTVRAGETSGNLVVVLNRLALYVEQQENLKNKIKNALFYPAILLVLGILVIIYIVSFVMPQFIEIFTKANIPLPLPTQILYQVGIGLKKFWYFFILGVAGIIFCIRVYLKTQRGSLQFDRGILDLPVIGPLMRKVYVSRFCRTLATLVDSSVPILPSLDIVADVVGNEIISRVVKNVRESVEGGERMAPTLKISQEFPPDAVQMIAVGEEGGKVGYMLNKIADFYDTAVGYSIKKLTALIEPLFLVIMGSMIGFIMASLILPIFDMVQVIKH